MAEFDLEHPPWATEEFGGDSDKWGDEQDRSDWFEAAANHWAGRAATAEALMQRVWIAMWYDDGNWDAQAYFTREAVERDFPATRLGPTISVIESTVQA